VRSAAGAESEPPAPAARSGEEEPGGGPAGPRAPWWHPLFFNERRLRSGWRLALFGLLLFVFGSVGFMMMSMLPPEAMFWASYPVLLVATLISSSILVARLDGRPVGALGFAITSATPREIVSGTAIGGALIALIAVLLALTGSMRWAEDPGGAVDYVGMMVGTLVFFAVAAAWEEALFRGYPFQVLVEGIGVWPAVLVSSAVFAWAHGQNPDVTLLALLNIFLAGVLLAVTYLRTRSLWFATAVHLGWNWMLAFWLDLPVSGLTRFDTPGYSGVETGPEWWTGGAFGPEAGAAATVVLIAGLLWLTRTRALSIAPEMAALGPIVDRRLTQEAT
jgi:uncharacterized protein